MASFLVRDSTLRGGDPLRGDAQLNFSYEGAGGVVFSGAAEVVVEVEFVASGGITFGGAARLSGRATSIQGNTGVLVHTPTFEEPEGVAGPLTVLEWRTSRYLNRVGAWEIVLPVDDSLIDGEPLHKQIRRGWHVSLLQENNGPNLVQEWYRLYYGVVTDREYQIAESGAAKLVLSGAFRGLHLVDRSTYDGLSYDETPDGIIDDLLDGDNIIGPNDDGASYPSNFSTGNLRITFHDISRYAAMVKIAELRRVALRESWRYDVPEFVRIDGPPDAHVIITNVESSAENLSQAALKGFALISGAPRVKFRGQEIVNRVIPIGSDTPDGDLTLQYSNITSPYIRQSAPKPGGGTYYYLEDPASIEKYGLIERPLIRTDVKNPSDTFATRQAAANVLYAVAVGHLLQHKSEAMIVEVELANGDNIWALPGDAVRLQYTGIAQSDSGTFTWLDEDRYFMVTERHDESTPSGVRNVRLVLAAPEIIMEIPDLPNEVPGTTPTNEEPGDVDPGLDPNEPIDPGVDPEVPGPGGEVPEVLPPIDTTPIPPGILGPVGGPECCDDPDVDIEEGPEEPPNIVDAPDADIYPDAVASEVGFWPDGVEGETRITFWWSGTGTNGSPAPTLTHDGFLIETWAGSTDPPPTEPGQSRGTYRIQTGVSRGETVHFQMKYIEQVTEVSTGVYTHQMLHYVGVTQGDGSVDWFPGTPPGGTTDVPPLTFTDGDPDVTIP